MSKKIFIIAEIGINHNGDIGICKDLIDVAADSGCDAVKLQKREINKVYTQEFLESPRESPWGNTQRHQKEALEFNEDDYFEIQKYSKSRGLEFFASSWDLDSQEFLRKLKFNYNKIASPMLVNKDLLEMVASEGKHTFISTGMSTFQDIDIAVEIFNKKTVPLN